MELSNRFKGLRIMNVLLLTLMFVTAAGQPSIVSAAPQTVRVSRIYRSGVTITVRLVLDGDVVRAECSLRQGSRVWKQIRACQVRNTANTTLATGAATTVSKSDRVTRSSWVFACNGRKAVIGYRLNGVDYPPLQTEYFFC